jgi:hypothetical protein
MISYLYLLYIYIDYLFKWNNEKEKRERKKSGEEMLKVFGEFVYYIII